MRAGRDPHDVKLVAVSKTISADAILEAYDAGLRAFGESRVQEAVEKSGALKAMGRGRSIRWHMIGHLQKNKVKPAVGLFELIHSMDSLKLLEAVNRAAGEIGKKQRVMIQVKLSGEDAKTGASEAELDEMLKAAREMDNVKVEGLMCIPPYFDDVGLTRPYFKRLRELADARGLKGLSMGMTNDFEIAIEEGATMVRVGTAIFGHR